jgi:SAM-dependent methyltransferase
MAFNLKTVVPWGRSFAEYEAMFALLPEDLEKRILGCGDGPASFNAVLSRRGGRIVSADPLYRFTAGQIRRRIEETCRKVLDQTRKNKEEFVWETITTVEELGRIRKEAMQEFLLDFPRGEKEGRYRPSSLPGLPFEDGEFDLALCSHLLFLYGEHLDEEFHLQSIREMCRVAGEVRIFPLLELGARPARHLEPVLRALKTEGFRTEVRTVNYEFQRGGNRMLRVSGRQNLIRGTESNNPVI